MKICFDTCAVIDIAGQSAWFEDAYISYDLAQIRRDDVYLSIHSTADIDYVLHRRGMSKTQAREGVALALQMFDVIDLIPADADSALQSEMPDYEDALIAFSAQRAGIDLILTRDEGFRNSPVPVMTPAEFVKRYCPENYHYETIDLSVQDA